jgi:hypothetical protein
MRPKARLPQEIAEPLGQLSNEIRTLSQQLEDEIYRLAVVERHPVTAIARATHVDEEVMKKRVARIRRRRNGVQVQEAA